MTSNLLKKAGEIFFNFLELQVQIILNLGLIRINVFSEFSGIGKVLSSLLYFLSNNPFNLS